MKLELYLATSVDQLGPDADEFDLTAYNRVLTDAWAIVKPGSDIGAILLCELVLTGKYGNWVGAAKQEREKGAEK